VREGGREGGREGEREERRGSKRREECGYEGGWGSRRRVEEEGEVWTMDWEKQA
jgi:hypothetical protein